VEARHIRVEAGRTPVAVPEVVGSRVAVPEVVRSPVVARAAVLEAGRSRAVGSCRDWG
jgi:hypothetical protein